MLQTCVSRPKSDRVFYRFIVVRASRVMPAAVVGNNIRDTPSLISDNSDNQQ